MIDKKTNDKYIKKCGQKFDKNNEFTVPQNMGAEENVNVDCNNN